MQRHEALSLVGQYVRVRSTGSSQHFGRGRLISVGRSTATVKPFWHGGRAEEVPLSLIRPWKAGNYTTRGGISMNSEHIASGNNRNTLEKTDRPQSETWVVQDVLSGKVFVSTYCGMRAELSRGKRYANAVRARKAIGHLQKRNGTCELRAVTLDQAQKLMDRLAGTPEPPTSPQSSTSSEPSPLIQASVEAIAMPKTPAKMTPEWVTASLELATAADELLKAEQTADAAQLVLDAARKRFEQARTVLNRPFADAVAIATRFSE